MKRSNLIRGLIFTGLLAVLVLGFQNCGGMRSGSHLFLDSAPQSPVTPVNEGTSTGNPPQSQMTFAAVAGSIFQPMCVQCHGGSNAMGNVRYDSYQMTKARGKLNQLARHYRENEEPDDDCTTVTFQQKQMVVSWIELGAPE